MNLRLVDFIVAPFVIVIIFVVAYLVRPVLTTSDSERYFIPALLVKIIGALALGLVYHFYYGGGDTFNYWHDAKIISSAFFDSPSTYLQLILRNGRLGEGFYSYLSRVHWIGPSAEFTLSSVLSILSLPLGGSYVGASLLFAVFSFLGAWYLYVALLKKYANLSKRLAYATLFIPSVIFWGSGVMKDTLTFGALCFIVGAIFRIMMTHKIGLREVFLLLFCGYLIYHIKIYILLTLFPAVAIWIYATYASSIRNVVIKLLIAPFLLVIFGGVGYYATSKVTEGNVKYSLDNLSERAAITAYDIRYYTGKNAGSGYSLGKLDGSWSSMLKNAPQAVNVSLFRPYLWEVKNPLMLLSAIESAFLLFFTVSFIFRGKFRNIWNQPFVIFCLVFSMIFAFAVGISTYNFGTLVRYKIPLMPFYVCALVIVGSSTNQLNKEKKSSLIAETE